jgi:Ca2+-binding RTX toxin-like protein
MPIRWTPVSGQVDVDYSTDRGTTWTKLVNSVPGGGSLTFPAPAVSSVQARIRVSKADGDPAIVTEPSDASDADFTIGPPLVDTGTPLQGVAASDFAWGDYDGDGDLDLAMCGLDTAGTFTPHAKVYRNDFGAFPDVAAPLPGVYNGALAWGDLDGDGDLDLLVGQTVNSLSDRVESIHLFKWDVAGGGLDQVATPLPSIAGLDAVAVADVDGDGCNDVVGAGSYGRGVVHLGDGTGSFDGGHDLVQLGYQNPSTATRVTMAVGDLTGDGLPDLVVTDTNAGQVMVYRNASTPSGGPCRVAQPPPVPVVPPDPGPGPAPITPPTATARDCQNPGSQPFLLGTAGPDVLVGTSGRDVLSGRGGADCLFGRSGDDRMSGGTGADTLVGSSGNDRMNGDAGADKVDGGNGNDKISAGAGKDKITAGGGNDTISARDGARDTIDCGAGRDKVTADRNDSVKSNCEHVKRG